MVAIRIVRTFKVNVFIVGLSLLCTAAAHPVAAAEYRPEAWNLHAREKFAEQRYGVFRIVH